MPSSRDPWGGDVRERPRPAWPAGDMLSAALGVIRVTTRATAPANAGTRRPPHPVSPRAARRCGADVCRALGSAPTGCGRKLKRNDDGARRASPRCATDGGGP